MDLNRILSVFIENKLLKVEYSILINVSPLPGGNSSIIVMLNSTLLRSLGCGIVYVWFLFLG